jgi:hypothetical protein
VQAGEEVIQAAWDRLAIIANDQDLRRALEPDAVEEVRCLAEYLNGDGRGDLLGLFILGWLRWYQYQVTHDSDILGAAVDALVPCFIRDVDGLPDRLLPALAVTAAPLAASALQEELNSADHDSLNATVCLWQRIVANAPPDYRELGMFQTSLAAALWTRFQRSDSSEDLEAAISAGRAAADAVPADNPERFISLSNLASALSARFARHGDTADLDAAIRVGHAAADTVPPGHSQRVRVLGGLGVHLRTRFERSSEPQDLDAVIAAFRAAADAAC